MDSIKHTQKLFARVDVEITAFIALLSEIAHHPDGSEHRAKAIDQLGQMIATAQQIGGKLYQDIELLKKDFHRYLSHAERLETIQQDALRIKHEVRAL